MQDVSSGMNEASYIHTRLREHRLRAGLTQGQLALRVEVSRQTINYLENGLYCPSTYLALRLARELGVRVEDLFTLSED
jgi:putative transcriptional regulator